MNATSPRPPAIVSTKHRRLVVPFNAALANLTPHGLPFVVGGEQMLAVPHDYTHTRLVRNFGIDAPAPVLHYYDWSGSTPFEAQRQTVAGLTTHERFYVLNGMGTGKTRSVIFAFDYLRKAGEANRMIVVAPLSTLTMTWFREVFSVAPHLKVNVLYGSRDKRLRLLADPADIYVINHDGMDIVQDEVMKRTDIDVVCLDELAVYRNGTSKRFKRMRKLLAHKKRVWGLTGSPTPNAPTDAWAQAQLVTPWRAPTGFAAFRESVMYKVTTFKWVPKPSALATVREMMQPSVRYTLDDVVELPDLIIRTVPIDQGPLQKKAYDQLVNHLYGQFAAGEVTVQNAGILMNKLLQVSMGWVYTDQRGVVEFDNDHRRQALLDAVESTDNKVIVFVPFIHALDGVAAHLRKHGTECEIVSGQTSQSERNRIFGAFQNSTDPRVVVAHPQCMAHGLTLTAADTIIWFGPFASLEVYEQANQRIRRVGQKNKQQILLFSGTKAESKLYQRLEAKQGVQNTLLDMFREQANP
jgi:SNF2 family DNA or RNA helicase